MDLYKGNDCAIIRQKTFINGMPEDVKWEAQAILDLFGDQGEVIINSVCEIPRWSSKENVRTLTDTVLEWRKKL